MFFSSQPKPVPTLRKIFTNRQGLKDAENSNCSSSNGFDLNLTTIPVCFRINRVVVFFDALEWLSFSPSYLLNARNGSKIFLGPCQVLVAQSFAFSYRLGNVRSLIEWFQSSFFVLCENPML